MKRLLVVALGTVMVMSSCITTPQEQLVTQSGINSSMHIMLLTPEGKREHIKQANRLQTLLLQMHPDLRAKLTP